MRSVTMIAAVALMTACGSDNNPSTNGGTTAGTSGFTRGVITAFGSVHLGDDIFTTNASTQRKRLDDGPDHIPGADDAVFRPGMVVEVFHRSDDKNATEIRFKDDLEGPITLHPSLTANATFDVLGVPVRVDPITTKFDNSRGDSTLTLNGLAAGNVVEVSGLFDAAGVLHATFIEGKKASAAAGSTFEIKGNIAGLSGTAPNQTFTVNGVSFITTLSTQASDLPTSGLANGMYVEVKTDTATPLAQPFAVTKIEGTFEDPEAEVRGADKAAVEGFVTGLTGTSPNFSFKLGATSVTTSSATTGANLVTADAHIEAEGGVVHGTINALTIGPRQ